MNATIITLADLTEGKYKFGPDVQLTKQEGCSPTGTKTKQPDSIFEVTYDFGGQNLADVVDNTLYKLGVNFRSSVRKHSYFPTDTTKVTVPASHGRMATEDMPLEARALAMFAPSMFESEEQRQQAIAAFLSVQS